MTHEPLVETGPPGPYQVLVVCLGNICRSPMAEAVLTTGFERAGLVATVRVSSAGTAGWHVGEDADPHAHAALRARGYRLQHTARQLTASQLSAADLVLAMDGDNVRAVHRLLVAPADRDRVRMMRSFDPTTHEHAEVPDPYQRGQAAYDEVLVLLERTVPGVIEHTRAALPARGRISPRRPRG